MLSRSNTKQDTFNKAMQEKSGKFISGELRSMIATAMGDECSVVPDENDNHVLLLNYPITFTFDDFRQKNVDKGQTRELTTAQTV